MMETAADIFVVGAVILCVMRVAGHKGNVYKAIAHVYVGLLFGLGIGMFERDDIDGEIYLAAAIGMTIVEIMAFVVTRAIPWARAKIHGTI